MIFKMKKLPLSVCLIIKDGAEFLSSALHSIADIASEIVIVNLNTPPSPIFTLNRSDKTTDQLREKNPHPNPLLPLEPINNSFNQSDKTTDLSRVKSGFKCEFFQWNDDFSAVKNYAIEQATQPWILFLAPNCFLTDKSRINLEHYLMETNKAYYIKYEENIFPFAESNRKIKEEISENIKGKHGFPLYPEFEIKKAENTSKNYCYLKADLFRNSPEIRYEGRVYEKLKNIDNINIQVADIKVMKCFYNKEQKNNEQLLKKHLLEITLSKNETGNTEKLYYRARLSTIEIELFRNLKFKKEEIKSRGQLIFSDRLLIQQIEKEENLKAKQLKEEIDQLIKDIELMEGFEFFYIEAAELLKDLDEPERAINILSIGLNKFPISSKIIYLLAINLYSTGKISEAKKWFSHLADLLENNGELLSEEKVEAKILDSDHIYFLLAKISEETSNFQELEFYLNNIKNQVPYQLDFPQLRKPDLLYINNPRQEETEAFNEIEKIKSGWGNDIEIIIAKNIVKKAEEPIYLLSNNWKELLLKYPTKEFIDGQSMEWTGVGIAIKNLPKKVFFKQFNFVSLSPVPAGNLLETIYYDNVELLKYTFADLGIKYICSTNELKKGYTNILFSTYSTPEISNYVLDYSYIPFQMEQISLINTDEHIKSARYRSHLRLLRGALETWDYSLENINHLNSLGINNVKHLSPGYHKKMEVINQKDKDIDILFYGELNLKRVIILNKLAEKGYRVLALKFVFGKERNSYIERAKIIINISRFPNSLLEEQRLSFLLNNRCFVISECPASNKVYPYEEGIVFCEYDQLVETCELYLKPENEALRNQVAQTGYQIFSQNKMTDKIKEVLFERI
jgi:hypothetical protein